MKKRGTLIFIFFGVLAVAMAVYAIFIAENPTDRATYVSIALGIMAFGMGLDSSISAQCMSEKVDRIHKKLCGKNEKSEESSIKSEPQQ